MTTEAPRHPEITIEPPPGACPPPRRPGSQTAEVAAWRSETLTELGLDPAITVIATGHQAAIWHPGILAKDLVIQAIRDRRIEDGHAATAIHFIADHDANDAGLVRLPAIAEDGVGLQTLAWRLRPPADGRSTRDRAAGPVAPPPAVRSPLSTLGERIETIRVAVDRRADEASLAMQLGLAAADLARPITGEIPRRSMSSLLQSPIGHALLARMIDDPAACIDAHDAAVEADRDRRARNGRRPRGVARLLGRGGSGELPLWRDTADGRRAVAVGEPMDAESLRPRALLATALARLGGCDLFVHGIGGGIYDRVMEDWLQRWLGPETASSLAPTIVATATLRLPLPSSPIGDPITPEAFHRMQHDPDLASGGSPTLSSHLARIDAAPRRSAERRAAYLELRRAIDAANARAATVLADAERRLGDQRRMARSNDIALDRTWAFPLHDPDALHTLRSDITLALATTSTTSTTSTTPPPTTTTRSADTSAHPRVRGPAR